MFLYDNFKFYHSIRRGHHYFDNRAGAPSHYLGYVLQGQCRIVTDSTVYPVERGQIVYVPKGLRYQSFWDGEVVDFYTLGYQELGVRESLQTRVQVVTPDGETVALLHRLCPVRGGAVTCHMLSLFYDIMDRLMPQFDQLASREERVVKLAKSYIRAHPQCNIPQVAEACGISEPYLYVVFKKALGTTPNEVRRQMLCEMAVDMLTATDLSVEEISDRLGFSSGAYFRKVFKAHIGTTPLTVRKTGFL